MIPVSCFSSPKEALAFCRKVLDDHGLRDWTVKVVTHFRRFDLGIISTRGASVTSLIVLAAAVIIFDDFCTRVDRWCDKQVRRGQGLEN